MRVTSVDIHASNSNKVMTLSFRDPKSLNPYIAKGILGLDAEEIISKFYGTSGLSNDKYYDLTLKKRTIVLQVVLNPNFASGEKTYSTLRDDLYKLISSSRTGAVQLRFKNGVETVAAISGFVTKLESPQFTKAPEVQLTIDCDDPMFRSLTEVSLDVSDFNETQTVVIDNDSTAPHGFQFGVIFTGTISSFTIKDLQVPTWSFVVSLAGTDLVEFVSGDKLQFSSEYNNRYLILVRGANTYHMVDRIEFGSVWPVIFPGENSLVCSAELGWEYITYYPTYWGV